MGVTKVVQSPRARRVAPPPELYLAWPCFDDGEGALSSPTNVRTNGRVTRVCLEAHDLVISKLVAGRQKDLEFATVLLRADLVDPEILLERAELLPVPGAVIRRVCESIGRSVKEAKRD